MTVNDIHTALRRLGGYHGVYVPEFTYGGRRIDAAVIDVSKRWIRGFEIKMSRSDWLRDEKWQEYSRFCSSLSVVCPEGLIQADEIDSPFGLLWIMNEQGFPVKWVSKPKRFQRRDALAWLYTYVSVIEKELPRLSIDVARLNRVRNHD